MNSHTISPTLNPKRVFILQKSELENGGKNTSAAIKEILLK